jgi:hypothetical protein
LNYLFARKKYWGGKYAQVLLFPLSRLFLKPFYPIPHIRSNKYARVEDTVISDPGVVANDGKSWIWVSFPMTSVSERLAQTLIPGFGWAL